MGQFWLSNLWLELIVSFYLNGLFNFEFYEELDKKVKYKCRYLNMFTNSGQNSFVVGWISSLAGSEPSLPYWGRL